MAHEGLVAPVGELPGGRRQFLKVCGGSVLATGAASLLTSCSISFGGKPSAFEVDAENWLETFALAIGAKVIKNVIKGGLQDEWEDWEPDVEEVGEGILEDGLIAADHITGGGSGRRPVFTTSAMEGGYRFIPGGVGYAHPVPPAVMLRASRKPQGDPKADLLVAFVEKGRKHIVFKPWAWQTLSLFVHYLTASQDPANLSVARAVCVLTLIPSGVRPRTGSIPGGLVDYYNYKTRNGNVRIALVQESNGPPTGVITASAIPGGDGRPLVKHFTLPAQAPGTLR